MSYLDNRPYNPLRKNDDVYGFCWQSLVGGILLTLAVISSISFSKVIALVCCAAVAVLMFGEGVSARLKERLSAPVLAVFAYVLMNAVSTIYALSGKFALNEFVKLLFAFGVYIVVLTRVEGTPRAIRSTASALAGSSAVIGLLSIDAASCGVLKVVLCAVWPAYGSMGIGFEEGTRMTGIFGNGNILAGILALGVLLSLYLALSAQTVKQRAVSIVMLTVNALSFLLAFSMGATGVFAVAVVVYLVFAGKDRIPALVLMVETAVFTVIFTFVSFLGMGQQGALAWLPVLAVVLNAAAVYFLHTFVGGKLSDLLTKKTKLAVVFGGAVVVVIAAYVGLGLLLTGPYSLSAGESLRRAAYPAPGAYTLTTASSQPVEVMVESQNMPQVMMHKSTEIYRGDAASAAFVVPENSKVVYFNFYSKDGALVESSAFTGDSGSTALPLKYKLFPGFIANRLQGLWANQNAIQRTVFFEDGLKMFQRSPIVGSGIGSYENAITGVQDFHYETKYAHNHYIQALAETGVIGCLLFLALLFFAGWSLWKHRKDEKFPGLIAPLCACLVMMAGHAMTEVIFSQSFFLPYAYGVFAIIAVCYGEPKITAKKALTAYRIPVVVLAAVFVFLLTGNLIANGIKSKEYNDVEEIFPAMETALNIDAFERNDYLLSYVLSATQTDDAEVHAKALDYAEKLSKVSSNSIQSNLAQFYFTIGEMDRAFEVSEKGIDYTKANPAVWQEQFALYESYLDAQVDSEQFATFLSESGTSFFDHVLKVSGKLSTLNEGRMETITLSAQNVAFIGRVEAAKALAGKVPEIKSLLQTEIYDSNYAIDLDHNGIPDGVSMIQGQLTMQEDKTWKLAANTTLNLGFYVDTPVNHRLMLNGNTEGITVVYNGAVLTPELTEAGIVYSVPVTQDDDPDNLLLNLQATAETAVTLRIDAPPAQ